MIFRELALAGLVLTIFFSTIVLLKKGKQLKDYCLLAFFVMVGCELFYRYIQSSIYYRWMFLFDIVYWSLLGPAMLLYIQSVRHAGYKLRVRHVFHLSILVFALFFSWEFVTANPPMTVGEYINTLGRFRKTGYFVWEFGSSVYLAISVYLLVKHKKSVKDFFSSTKQKELNWLLFLTIGFSVYIFSSYILWALHELSLVHNAFYPIHIIVPILTIYVFGVGLFGFRQGTIWPENQSTDFNGYSSVSPSIKYGNTGLSKEESEKLIKDLDRVMIDEKPYLDSELTIGELAGRLDTSIHKLSQVINGNYRSNFCDFINSYRIREFMDLAKQPEKQKFKIIHIAYESGFNSKSGFYNAFKKHTKKSPGEYFQDKKV